MRFLNSFKNYFNKCQVNSFLLMKLRTELFLVENETLFLYGGGVDRVKNP